jgi:hypothetical protein
MDVFDCTAPQVKAIGFYGGASEGMRTMLDALIPAVTTLESGESMSCPAVPKERLCWQQRRILRALIDSSCIFSC